MQFNQGAHVYTAAGQAVGAIDRVVLDPRTQALTHVVVRRGGRCAEDKLVPIAWAATTTPDRVTLRAAVDDYPQWPAFEATHYVSLREASAQDAPGRVPVLLSYPPLGAWWRYPGGGRLTKRASNTPEGTAALQQGATVVSADKAHMGTVERVFADAATAQATHFVIARGLFGKTRKLIPTPWVDTVSAEAVYLAVEARVIDNLPAWDSARHFLTFFPAIKHYGTVAVVGAAAYLVTTASKHAAVKLARADFTARHPQLQLSSPAIVADYTRVAEPWSYVVAIPATSPDPEDAAKALITIGAYFVDASDAREARAQALARMRQDSPAWTPLEKGHVIASAQEIAALLAAKDVARPLTGVPLTDDGDAAANQLIGNRQV